MQTFREGSAWGEKNISQPTNRSRFPTQQKIAIVGSMIVWPVDHRVLGEGIFGSILTWWQNKCIFFLKTGYFELGRNQTNDKRNKQTPFFSTHQCFLNPTNNKKRCVFSITIAIKECLVTCNHRIANRGLWRMSGPGCLWMEAMYRVQSQDAIRMSPWRMRCRTRDSLNWLALSREWGNQPLHWYIGDSCPIPY